MSDLTYWAMDVVCYHISTASESNSFPQISKETDTTIMEKPGTLFLTVAHDTKHPKTPPSMLLFMVVPATHYLQGYLLSEQVQSHPASAITPSAAPSLPAPAQFPEIAPWLFSLNEDAYCRSPNIDFSIFSEPLCRNGFCHINQLASEFVSIDWLMDLLQTNYGTVVELLQYAKEDVETCRKGKAS